MTINDDSDDALISDEKQCYQDNPSSNSISYAIKNTPTYKSISSEEEQKENDNQEEKGRRSFLKSFTVEPLMTLFMLAFMIRMVCSQNLLIDKSCLYVFNQSVNVCSNLDNYTQEKKQIETYANNYSLFIRLIQTIPAVFFSVVIGPWSDKYGRKLPIIMAMTGGILENIGTMLNVIYFEAPLYYLLISAIPGGISGGMVSIILCIYSLASEQTTPKQRTIKYAFIELAFGIGAPLGSFLGGLLFKEYGYLSVYILSTSFQVAAVPWVIFVLRESRPVENRLRWKIISDLFRFDNFKESIHTIIKPREKNRRLEIWLLVLSMCTLISTLIATDGFGYYFARWMYKFDVTTYSNVNTIFICCGMVVSVLLVVVLARVFKLKNIDTIYGVIGSISLTSSNITKAFAAKPWIYYVACSLGVFGGVAMLAVRSILSKIVGEDELGKVFAFLASCESLTPVVASVVYTQIFNASIDFFPGLAYLVTGLMIILPLSTFAWMTHRRKKLYEVYHQIN